MDVTTVVPGTVRVVTAEAEQPLVARLRGAGVRVRTGQTVPRGRSAESPDVMVLDARLSTVPGLELVRSLRAARLVPGILVIGEFPVRDDETVCAYFAAGADEVLGTPTSVDETVARVRALLRRIGPSRASMRSAVLDGFALDTECRTVRTRDARIPLTRTELELITVLATHADRVVSRGQLLESVWGLSPEDGSNVLNTCVYLLRRKLESHGAPHLIHTVRGVGFRLRTG
ncbi:MAG: response regulator transcription factor [Rhodococcus sp. (in: high G+C Gram-positive bacteria)]